jgi:hypothetical protein
MNISLIIPINNFLEELPKELEKLGHKVIVNDTDCMCDFMIGMSMSVIGQVGRFHYLTPNVPLILYNWDWYDFVDKKQGVWVEFTRMMGECKEVWSASKITAEKCQKDTLIKSPFWNYAYILPNEWKGETKDDNFILQASRNDESKRFDWFERAGKENNIPTKSYHPPENSRPDYIKAIQECSILCCCSKDESLGTLSVAEAVYNKKPVLIADFEGAKEVWGDRVWYFEKDNYEDLVKTLKWLYENRESKEVKEKVQFAYERCLDVFMPDKFAERMSERLLKIK